MQAGWSHFKFFLVGNNCYEELRMGYYLKDNLECFIVIFSGENSGVTAEWFFSVV